MDLGGRISKFTANRKISFDGECYHSRLPLEIVKILQQYGVELSNVQWEGVWMAGKSFRVILIFGEKIILKEASKTTEDNDYVVLKV